MTHNQKLGLFMATCVVFGAAHAAGEAQTEPVELLINYQVSGTLGGFVDTDGDTIPDSIMYTISGPGFAPLGIARNGEISDAILPLRQAAFLAGAEILFPIFNLSDPASIPDIVDFTCVSGSCNMHLGGGSILTSDAGVPLSGRAPFLWGPIINSPEFVPDQVLPVRILGCGGLKEITGSGRYAGMVGSICFNGELNFDLTNPIALTGSSKCTITLHTPADPNVIP